MCAMDESRGQVCGDDSNILRIDGIVHKEEWRRPTEDHFFRRVFQRIPLNEVVEELRVLGKLVIPVAITSLLVYSKSIISMLFLSHLGKIELAGGSLAIGFANVTGFSVMKGLCMGMDPICCQAYGAKRWSVLSQTYLKTFLLLLITSIPISFLWLNAESVFQYLGQDLAMTKVAKIYLIFTLPESLAVAHLQPLRSFLRTQELNLPASIVATCSTILHLPINYFLVMYLKLGIKGIALASVCHTYNMNIGLLLYLYFSKVSIKPWVARASLISTAFHGWRPLLTLAIPSLCSVCLEWWWYEIILFIGGLLKNLESCVAAIGIMMQTTGMVYVFPYAISLSISQRVGHELGAGQPSRAQLAATVGISVALVFGLMMFGLSIMLKSVLGKLYTNEQQILSLISSALPILGLAEVGNASQTAACGALTGSARPKVGVHINVAGFYLIGLPVAVILAFTLRVGFQGLWLGLVAAQTSCSLLMVYTLVKTDWKDQAKRAEELTMAVNDDSTTNLIP